LTGQLNNIASPVQEMRDVFDLMPTSTPEHWENIALRLAALPDAAAGVAEDRKSTRLNSSHVKISYAVFCLKKKKNQGRQNARQHRRRDGTSDSLHSNPEQPGTRGTAPGHRRNPSVAATGRRHGPRAPRGGD